MLNTISAKKKRVTLYAVADINEEQEALACLGDKLINADSLVSPVLNQQNLILRLRSAFEFAGYETECITWNNRLALHSESKPKCKAIRPDAVFFSPSIDVSVVNLAGALCGVSPRALMDIETPNSHYFYTALVLLDSPTQINHSVLIALEKLASQQIAFGFICANDAIEMRFNVIKALLVSNFSGTDSFSIMDADTYIVPTESEELERIFSVNDVLVFGGHANGLDAQLGHHHVLCSREGNPEAKDGVFPCFHNGTCFRIRETNTQSVSHRVKPEDINSRITIATGCNLTTITRSWYAREHGLVNQFVRGNMLALVASSSLNSTIPELDFYAIALIAQGWQLGKVVRHLNSVKVEEFGLASGHPEGLGPFLLFGNPCLHYENWRLEEVDATISYQDQDLYINCDLQSLSSLYESHIVRVNIPAKINYVPYLSFNRSSTNFSLLGIWYCDPEYSAIYLWVRPDNENRKGELSERANSFYVCCHRTNPNQSLITFLDRFAAELRFWPPFLTSYGRDLQAYEEDNKLIETAQLLIPTITLNVLRARKILELKPGVLTDTTNLLERTYEPIAHQVSALTSILLDISVAIALRLGSLQFIGWQPYYSRKKEFGPIAVCSCNNGVIYGQRFESPGLGSHVRAIYQCSSCGPIGEDDGRRIIIIGDDKQQTSQGDKLLVRCEMTAPQSEVVYSQLCCVLECWYKARRMISLPANIVLQPGFRQEIQLEIDVPFDLEKGIYALAVIGLVNGALYISRRMVKII
jgi:hypothetical protein